MKTQILEYLINCKSYVSGQDISKDLNVSRNTVWKHINSLRADGYVIDSMTNKGYKIISIPDVLNESQIQNGLKTQRIGKKIIHFKEIDSTNEEIKRQIKTDCPTGLVCTAEKQLNGKGRLGRTWLSEFGKGIWTSILLRPEISPMEVTCITLISGLAVAKSIKNITGLNASIKWPNDILVNDKKVCGILTEMSAQAENIDYIIIGIGVNVNNLEFPEEIAYKATSLCKELGKEVSRSKLLKEILYNLEIYTDEFVADFSSNLIEKYKDNCITIGRKVSVIRKGVEVSGIATDITKSGALIIKTDDSEKLEVSSGEVTVQGLY